MGLVLTVSSEVGCGHAPGRVATQGAAKLVVAGGLALTKAGVAGKSVAGCGTVASADASGPIDTPCTTVASVSAGEATKLFVGGAPVMLDTLSGGTDGLVAKTPAMALKGTPGHAKLEAA